MDRFQIRCYNSSRKIGQITDNYMKLHRHTDMRSLGKLKNLHRFLGLEAKASHIQLDKGMEWESSCHG